MLLWHRQTTSGLTKKYDKLVDGTADQEHGECNPVATRQVQPLPQQAALRSDASVVSCEPFLPQSIVHESQADIASPADSLRLVERFVPEPWADSSQLKAVPLNYSDKLAAYRGRVRPELRSSIRSLAPSMLYSIRTAPSMRLHL